MRAISRMILLVTLSWISMAFGQIPAGPVTQKMITELKSGIDWVLQNANSTRLEIRTYPVTTKDSIAGDIESYSKLRSQVFSKYPFLQYTVGNPVFFKVWKLALETYSFEQRLRLAKLIFYQGVAPGEYINMAHGLPSSFYVAGFFQESEVAEALRKVAEASGGVTYDGANARYVFSDQQLRDAILIAGSVLSADKVMFRSAFEQLLKSTQIQLLKNSNVIDAASRVEPFDLIQEEVTNGLMNHLQLTQNGFEINKVGLGNIVRRGMYDLLKSSPAFDARAAELVPFSVIYAKDTHKEALLLCGSREPSSGHSVAVPTKKGNTGTSFLDIYHLEASDIGFDPNDNSVNFECGGRKYHVGGEVVYGKPLDASKPWKLVEGRKIIRALIPVALVDSVDAAAVKTMSVYLASKGYQRVDPIQVVDTRKEFSSDFIDTDILIPVAHALDINRLHVGSNRSKRVVFTKTITGVDGIDRQVEVTILAPKLDHAMQVYLRRKELVDLLIQRRKKHQHAMFILNTSCNSANSIVTWTRAYRESLVDGSDYGDLPHVMGSENAFPTADLSDIMSNFSYPLNTLEILGSGQSPRQVFEMLSKKPQQSLIDSILSFLNLNSKSDEGFSGLREFLPVYNIDEPKLLTAETVTLIIKSLEGTRNVYRY